MKVRIYRNLVIAVFLVHTGLAVFEAVINYQCQTRGECLPWFYSQLLNFPVSILVHYIPLSRLMDTSSVAGVLVTGAFFLLVGTLWWSLVLHVVAYIGVVLRNAFSQDEAKDV